MTFSGSDGVGSGSAPARRARHPEAAKRSPGLRTVDAPSPCTKDVSGFRARLRRPGMTVWVIPYQISILGRCLVRPVCPGARMGERLRRVPASTPNRRGTCPPGSPPDGPCGERRVVRKNLEPIGLRERVGISLRWTGPSMRTARSTRLAGCSPATTDPKPSPAARGGLSRARCPSTRTACPRHGPMRRRVRRPSPSRTRPRL